MKTNNIDVAVSDIKKDIHYLTEKVEEGFKGIHERQDISNGRLKEHDLLINKINSEISNVENKNECDKVKLWQRAFYTVLGILTTFFIGIIFILFKLNIV